jgi:hypothetical protein
MPPLLTNSNASCRSEKPDRHDTSPRGEAVPDDPTGAYDFGLGAGFYVAATEEPFASNYRMWTLPASSPRRLLLTKGR